MYEMEGALPSYATLSPPVARQTPRHAPPAGTGYPREVPVSRRLPRPGVAPGRFPFPTVKVFLLLFPVVAQGYTGIHFEFFFVHTISTEYRRLSACIRGYPLAHAQLIHRLVTVIQRVPIGRSLNVIRWAFPATSGGQLMFR